MRIKNLSLSIASSFGVLGLCLVFSCCKEKTSSSPVNSASSANESAAKQDSPAAPQNQNSPSVLSIRTYYYSSKYQMAFQLGGFGGLTNDDGNFSDNFSRLQKELKRVVENESEKFDLSKQQGLSAFGNYLGRQLSMSEQDIVILSIIAQKSGKMLFAGGLRRNGAGSFELHKMATKER